MLGPSHSTENMMFIFPNLEPSVQDGYHEENSDVKERNREDLLQMGLSEYFILLAEGTLHISSNPVF